MNEANSEIMCWRENNWECVLSGVPGERVGTSHVKIRRTFRVEGTASIKAPRQEGSPHVLESE